MWYKFFSDKNDYYSKAWIDENGELIPFDPYSSYTHEDWYKSPQGKKSLQERNIPSKSDMDDLIQRGWTRIYISNGFNFQIPYIPNKLYDLVKRIHDYVIDQTINIPERETERQNIIIEIGDVANIAFPLNTFKNSHIDDIISFINRRLNRKLSY